LALGLAGCATAPVQETRAFVQAVSEVRTAHDGLIDDVERAERANGQRQFFLDNSRTAFSVRAAPYFAANGDPPLTAALGRSLRILETYADLILSLVDGRSVEAARASASAFIAAVQVIGRTPAVAAAAAELTVVFDQLQAARDIEAARRIVLGGRRLVAAVIEQLKASTADIFEVVTTDLFARPMSDRQARIDAYRVAASTYVVLMDRLGGVHEALVRAYEERTGSVSLAEVSRLAGLLAADVRAVRRALAAARAR
jgi:hypothetical protein